MLLGSDDPNLLTAKFASFLHYALIFAHFKLNNPEAMLMYTLPG